MLIADLHTHAADDPLEKIGYSSEMLIMEAARSGVQVLGIAAHEGLAYSSWLAEFAAKQDVLLMPATELTIERKHVLILNPHPDHLLAKTFDDLRQLKGKGELIVAPHPYYPTSNCLGNMLLKHIDLFDAVELCGFHVPLLRCNQRAQRVARQNRLPLIATTDTHMLPYRLNAYTLVESERTVESVLRAIREGKATPVIARRSAGSAYAAFCRVARSTFFAAVMEHTRGSHD